MQRIKEIFQSAQLRLQIGRRMIRTAGLGNRGCGGWGWERGVSSHPPSVRRPPAALINFDRAHEGVLSCPSSHISAMLISAARLTGADDEALIPCQDEGMQTVYEAAGSDEGLRRLAAAWHVRVMADEVVSHAFSHGFHPDHIERLAGYWAEALGGPTTYSASYGDESLVIRLHSGNGPHEEMDERAISCFDHSLVDVGLTENDDLYGVLHDYFVWTTTTTMPRYPRSADDVPDGLHIPHWSWDGLQS